MYIVALCFVSKGKSNQKYSTIQLGGSGGEGEVAKITMTAVNTAII
jgi:hypothetical protein